MTDYEIIMIFVEIISLLISSCGLLIALPFSIREVSVNKMPALFVPGRAVPV